LPDDDGSTCDGALMVASAPGLSVTVCESVALCLADLAADRPLLIALDDLHWADEPSIRLLGFLARALTGSRVLLVGAYRESEASPDLVSVAVGCFADPDFPPPVRTVWTDNKHGWLPFPATIRQHRGNP